LAKENCLPSGVSPEKTCDSYLDTKKRRTSKTVKTNFSGRQNGAKLRSTITLGLAKMIR
jgi:hypothetical protein